MIAETLFLSYFRMCTFFRSHLIFNENKFGSRIPNVHVRMRMYIVEKKLVCFRFFGHPKYGPIKVHICSYEHDVDISYKNADQRSSNIVDSTNIFS